MLAVSFEAVVQPTAPSTRSASGFLCVVFVSDKKIPGFLRYFCGVESSWNYFDMFLLITSIVTWLKKNSCKNADGGWRAFFWGFGASKAFQPEKMHQCSYDHGNQWLTVNLNFRPYFLGGFHVAARGGPGPLRFPWGWHHPDLRYCWEWCLFTYPAIACFPLGSVDPNVPSGLAAKLHQIACSLSCFKWMYPDVTFFFF